MADSTAQREAMIENKRKQLKLIEQKNLELFERVVAGRKEQERAIVALIEDKTSSIRTDLAKQSNIREEDSEQLKTCLEVIAMLHS